MNIVEQIRNQLSAGIPALSSQIGAGETATRSAVNAGAPALLAALSGLAGNSDGARKLANALGKFEPSVAQDFAPDRPGPAIDQGTSTLDTLFGNATLTGIVNAICRYTGLNAAAAHKLLGFLTPATLAAIAARFAGRPATPEGLTQFFAEERANITNALPAGFSLSDIPGVPNVGSVLRPDTAGMTTPQRDAAPMRWLVPLLGLAAVAVVMFFVFRGPTLSVPGAEKVTTELNDACKSLNGALAGITDEASAESASRELKKLNTTLDGIKAQVKKLPEADKAKVMGVAKSNLDKAEEQYARLVWVPGVREKVRPAMDDVMTQLAAMGGVPAPKTAAVSGEVAGAVSAFTEALRGIKDGPSAELARVKLKEIDTKLEDVKADLAKASESTRTAIAAKVKPAVERLREQADKVQAMPGVAEKVKPVIDSILEKLNDLSA